MADQVSKIELQAEAKFGELDADARREELRTLIGDIKKLHHSRRQRELTHAMQAAEKAGDMATIKAIEAQLHELMV